MFRLCGYSKLSLAVVLLTAANAAPLAALSADALDGFTSYCTGNLDGTGYCFNQETNQRYTCIIIPGQVIDCKSKGGKPFQCVWISSVQSNQAEFWCDPSVDAMLSAEVSGSAFRQQGLDPLQQRPQDPSEFQSDAFHNAIPSDLGSPF